MAQIVSRFSFLDNKKIVWLKKQKAPFVTVMNSENQCSLLEKMDSEISRGASELFQTTRLLEENKKRKKMQGENTFYCSLLRFSLFISF